MMIRTGDFIRIYFREKSEAIDYLYNIKDLKDVNIKETDIEDVYLFNIREEGESI
jgi:hypothetical protein